MGKLIKFYVAIVLFSVQYAFAANFSITPIGTLPTKVVKGQSVSASYLLTNLTSSARNGYTIQGLPATVTQNSSSPTYSSLPICGNPINLAANARCTLRFNISGAVSSNFAICKGTSCTTATTPLNVAETTAPAMPRFLYVANYNGTIGPATLCSLSPSTGEILSCDSSQGGTIASGPEGLALNALGTWAYITGENTSTSDVYQCPVNSDGTFGTCSSVIITSPASFYTYYGSAAVNPVNAVVYFSGYISSPAAVVACPLNNGIISPTCVDTGAVLNNYQIGITINSTGTTAYMTNAYGTGVVTVCDISSNGTAFTNCVNKTGGSAITFSNDIGSSALSPDGSVIYIADYLNNAVYGCSTTPNNTPTFASCFLAGSVNQAWGIAINTAGTVAYVAESFGDITYTCPIKADKTFAACTSTSGFVSAGSVALKY